MAYVPLEVTLISAKDLADVNVFSKMEVYAVATISGDATSKKKTPVDREGSRNPTWNSELRFDVMGYGIERAVLHVVLKSERALGDREIGEVHVPVCELLEGWNRAAAAVAGGGGRGGGASGGCSGDFDKKVPAAQFVSYQVRKNTGKAKGVLNISYKFGEFSGSHTPTHVSGDLSAASYTGGSPPPAYPPHAGPTYSQPAGSTYSHPSQPGHGYAPPLGYPPPHGYGYPSQQGGYGYPPQHHGYGYGYGGPREHGSSASGGAATGLELGLLSGAIGGILGAVVADAIE